MKICDVLDRDPRTSSLANNGQARITETVDDQAKAELRAELETFVCEGQFRDALQRILERYLSSLGKSRQEAAWVSGFFGSGKSHLLKMLTHLWVNTRFRDGANARTLVRRGLPDEIKAQLRELDTQAQRIGKPPVAAAGTLLGGSVDHVRSTVLSILLRARGWPAQYPQARFCFWLRDQGQLEAVRGKVKAAGKSWLGELNNLYVSPVIARALIQADSSFAADVKSARQVLIQQFPQLTTDISTEQFIEMARKALADDGTLPLTVLVLDEVQQYINEVRDRSGAFTDIAEAIQTEFDSRVMLVGAGQSALSAGTPALMWLRDRFRLAIELTDADVESVTRKVLLHKKPSAVPVIRELFEVYAGEVARHLQGTQLGVRTEDHQYSATDYPLLCTRRRFWEACFQAVDAAGSQSQLRSQLRILHDSLQEVAERAVGATIPASDLFDALAPSLVNTGVLLNELNTRIQQLDDGTEDGRLRRDLCGLIFLIGKLPRAEGVDTGVRADDVTLADLLVDDVRADSGPFRKRLADTLDALADDGAIMRVGGEFRLQTTEGAEWDGTFRVRQTALRQSEVEIASRRNQLFRWAVQEMLGSIKLVHGAPKLRRTLALHIGNDFPAPGDDKVKVWLRDDWSVGFRETESTAQRLGAEDPTLHVHLPKKSADLLKNRIVDVEAARQVLDYYGVPTSPEGQEARESMKSRRANAEQERDAIMDEIVRSAKVLQGGGSEIFGMDLGEKLDAGAQASLARLFPRFGDADHKRWEAALRRARDGSDQPLKAVDWEGATDAHPVSQEVLAAIGTGARGTEIHKKLKAPPYGWPQDAIDAVLLALHRSDHLRATRNGQPVSEGNLDQTGIKITEFRPERIRLTTSQRIALRGLFAKLNVTPKSGEEQAGAPLFLDALAQLGGRVGGPAPLPPLPDTTIVDDLKHLAGNEQLAEIHARKEDLERQIASWTELERRAERRMSAWEQATEFRCHAQSLSEVADVGAELDAICTQRSLLTDTDQVGPLVGKLAGALRRALAEQHAELQAAIETAAATLAGDATWSALDVGIQEDICRQIGLQTPPALSVATDEDLKNTLDAGSLNQWQSEVDAVARRTTRALEEASRRLEAKDRKRRTTIVEVRRGTLPDGTAVREWLNEQEEKLVEAVKDGPVIVR